MQQINLNLVPSGVPPVVYASQYDVGRIFRINLFDGNDNYTVPDGAVVTLVGTKTDMHSFAYSSEDNDPKVKVDGSAITVTTTEQMCAMPGNTLCEISVRKSTTLIIGSLNFILHVEKAIVPEDGFLNASDLNAFEEMSSKVQLSYEYFKDFKDFKESIDHLDSLRQHVDEKVDSLRQYVDEKVDYMDDEIAKLNASLVHISKMTLIKDNWTGTEAPYSYDLGTEYKEKIVELILDAQSMTEDDMAIAGECNIVGGEGSVMYALNEKPTVDIPVVIGYTSFIRKETS